MLDTAAEAEALRRVDAAHARMDRGALPVLAEFDVIRGLTGIGGYLLHRAPDGDAFRAVLQYLVRLTEPVVSDGELLPGWWTATGPSGRPSQTFPGGHGNAGIAHGIAGPLALLALAAIVGVTVEGQLGAIGRICGWLDTWRDHSGAGAAWPYWITRAEARTGQRSNGGVLRPGWCYGTAGLARAQQLAALALRDVGRQHSAECALSGALADPAQIAAVTDGSLCHGYAGIAQAAGRAAADADPWAAGRLRSLADGMRDAINDSQLPGEVALACEVLPGHGGADPTGFGLLDGVAGIGLAVLGSAGEPAACRWDACLLIS